jgi:hypothetical protein
MEVGVKEADIAVDDTKYHLGTADPEKIELVKIGYDKDIFV